ncbi:MAG: (4Fe-4S)-binding protein [Actinobacteria bacterium]|nr:(4Fe-4S)-binding protein [Actinomycetota bacterium]
MVKKKKKVIKINIDKCNGCRRCEMICSASHSSPKYSVINPARSRIRVVRRELDNIFVPVISSGYTNAECAGRNVYAKNSAGGLNESQWEAVADKNAYEKWDAAAKKGAYEQSDTKYGECTFCGVSCPSRDIFKEPDSGLPLKCDMCEDQEEPLCVQWCMVNALTCEESEEEVEEEAKLGDMKIGLKSLVDKYGLQKLVDAVARMSKRG